MPKYRPKYQSRFKKHYQNMIRANRYTEAEFKVVEDQILSGKPVAEKYDDHVIKSRKPNAPYLSRAVGCSFTKWWVIRCAF